MASWAQTSALLLGAMLERARTKYHSSSMNLVILNLILPTLSGGRQILRVREGLSQVPSVPFPKLIKLFNYKGGERKGQREVKRVTLIKLPPSGNMEGKESSFQHSSYFHSRQTHTPLQVSPKQYNVCLASQLA